MNLTTQTPTQLAKAHDPRVDAARSLWNILQDTTRRQPSRTAFICAHQPANHLSWLLPHDLRLESSSAHLEWSYAQLLAIGQSVGILLIRAGLTPGSNLMVLCANNAEWAALFWGCAAVGIAFAPMNPGLLTRQKELRHVFETLTPSGIATSEPAWAAQLTANCKDLLQSESVKICTLLTDVETTPVEGWTNGQSLFETNTSHADVAHHYHNEDPEAQTLSLDLPAVILSTSGTTSMPKLCCHTHRNVDAQSQHYGAVMHIDAESRGIPIGPGFHILAVCSAISIWRGGGAIITPSAQFNAAAVVDVMNRFSPSHIACTPAIMYALAAQPSFSPSGYPSLDNVSIGADQVTKELIEQVADTFKPKRIRNGWGMTEGISILGSVYEKEGHPWLDDNQSVGHVLGGSAVKICAPDSTEILVRGSLGELHISGPAVIAGYYAKGGIYHDSSFYEMDRKTWFKTGDAMIMDSDGWAYMKGRYKDLIIQGGENVSPSSIESCLQQSSGIQAQVVGVEDHFSGQAIVAVIKLDDDRVADVKGMKEHAQKAVLDNLGASHRLTAVYTLPELGLTSFPLTATNKVRKAELRSRVRALLENRDNGRVETGGAVASYTSGTVERLLGIWQGVIGANAAELKETTSVLNQADSLGILRFCFQVEKRLGKRVTPADLFDKETPELQAKFLDDQAGMTHDKMSPTLNKNRTTAKALSAMEPNVRKILSSHLAQKHYIFDVDVEDVYCGIDSMDKFELNTTRPASDNLRLVCRTSHDITIHRLRQCLIKCLTAHANLRSIMIPLEPDNTTPRVRHVVMKPSERWMNALVETVEAIDADELKTVSMDPSRPFARVGQSSFRAQIFPIKGSNRPGVLMMFNHAVFDAVSTMAFFEDLDAVLSNNATQLQRIPYGVFADMFHLHKSNAIGQSSASYQLKKFDQLENIESCLWPKSNGPGFLIGDDEGWRYQDGIRGDLSQRKRQDGFDGTRRGGPIVHAIEVPSLPTIRSKYSVEPVTIVKSAIAIFNAEQTKQHRAVFATCDAGRKWPFQEPWVQEHLPNTMHVAGPTMGWTFDFIPVNAEESVGAMLNRVGEMQKLDTEHCHAPWASIIDDLGREKGGLVADIAVRQLLTWDPTTQSRSQGTGALNNLEMIDRRSTPDHGFLWNLGVESPTRVGGFVIYDDVHLSASEVRSALKRVLEMTKRLASLENWEKSVRSIQVER